MENGRKLFAKLQEKGFDGAILLDEVSQHWASGFAFTDGAVMVGAEETLLLTDSRYIEAARTGVAPDVRPTLFAKLYGKKRCMNKLEAMAKGCSYEDSKYIGCLVWGSDGVKGVFPKEWFASTVDVSFEGRTFLAPVGYDQVLRRLYGDYMQLPPEKDRIAHHFYKAYQK